MERGHIKSGIVFLAIVVGCGALGFLAAPTVSLPRERGITVRAHRYGYSPEIIRVNRGDRIRLRFISEDVRHGFYLEGYDLDVDIPPLHTTVALQKPSQRGEPEMVEEVKFTANREGKFRYRCSKTCGFLHPFMLGELIVSPNRLLPLSLGLTVGVLVGGLFIAVKGAREGS